MSDLYQAIVYANLAGILRNLPTLVFRARRQRQLSRLAAAREMGLSITTLTKFELGHGGVTALNAAVILDWLSVCAEGEAS